MIDEPLAAWWRVIANARWFGGKGLSASLEALTPLPWLTDPGTLPAVRPEVATVRYVDGRTEHYVLLVGHTASPAVGVVAQVDHEGLGRVSVVDATADPDCMGALLSALTDPRHAAMEWLDASAIEPSAECRVWPGEQSNTTICIGPDRMLKLFRKVEPGRNLDVEVLTALNGSGVTPEVYGTLLGDLPDGVGRADLGMFVERVQNVRDGWEWACAACADDRDISAEAMQLGGALRAVHQRLADVFGTAVVPGAELAALIGDRLDAAEAQVGELAAVRSSVQVALSALAATELVVQRVHGDFHLGQVLRSADGWTIIDFEGEPLKTLAERRRPDSVWRDVAGMVRSFDYVRGAHPEPTSAQAVAWAATARQAFLDGYCEEAAPDRPVLDAYELDKAIYEVVYETRNRPDWVHIPLGAVHNVARRTTPSPTHNSKEN
ncbi:phosphotransferase [Micropruina sp.]|uniref:phosphotransferase n=1 Tax=Micropruina sp. TaxID=2737536 RepID=UPI0039E69E08